MLGNNFKLKASFNGLKTKIKSSVPVLCNSFSTHLTDTDIQAMVNDLVNTPLPNLQVESQVEKQWPAVFVFPTSKVSNFTLQFLTEEKDLDLAFLSGLIKILFEEILSLNM